MEILVPELVVVTAPVGSASAAGLPLPDPAVSVLVDRGSGPPCSPALACREELVGDRTGVTYDVEKARLGED
mgnify:CR=1 FL=1